MASTLKRQALPLAITFLSGLALGSSADAACCYFSAKNADILQPAQKAFITWDPDEKIETFTVQPKFEGNALDFGIVIPTPSQPKLDTMPRDFFKHLAVYGILKKRVLPVSKLLQRYRDDLPKDKTNANRDKIAVENIKPPRPSVVVLESGVVGTLDYKIIAADRADDLYEWLKDHKYQYAGDEATLGHYMKQKWIFTVMKIDTAQMKRNQDGTFAGEVTPTRFQFTSDKLVYPLKITQISVKDKTEALFYVQAPYKVDLPGDVSYQHMWVPMLQPAVGCTPDGLPGGGMFWLKDFAPQIPKLTMRSKELGYVFRQGQRPQPGKNGHIPTTMEWARKLTAEDIKVLRGMAPFGEKVPDVDEGFTQADLKDEKRRAEVYNIISERLAKLRRARPGGYLVREAPATDLKQLQHLTGHLREGQFITKFRKMLLRDEMNDDLQIVAARYGDVTDNSEYEEILPTSPP